MTPNADGDARWGRRSFLAAAASAPVAGLSAPSAGAAPARGATAAAGIGAPMPAIVPRSQWGNDLAPRGAIPAEDVRFLIVHHTLQPGSDYTAGDVPRLLRGIYSFHTGAEKAWPDVAYNFFVDKFGTIYEGRTGSIDGPVQGSATGGNQGFTQLCCFLGDYSVDVPPPAALTSMYRLLAWLADRYGVETTEGATVQVVSRGSNRWKAGVPITAPTIAAHREMSQTECPGDACFALVKSTFPGEVSALRGAAPAATTSTVAATTTSVSPTTPPTTTTAVPPSAPPESATSDPGSASPPDDEVRADGAAAGQVEVVDTGSGLMPWVVGLGGIGAIGGGAAAVVARRNRVAGDQRVTVVPVDAPTEPSPDRSQARPLDRYPVPAGELVWHLGGPGWHDGAAAIEAGFARALPELTATPGWAQRPARLLAIAAAVIDRSAPESPDAGAWLIGRDGADTVILLVGAARGLLENDDGGRARVPPGPSAVSLTGARLVLRSAPVSPRFIVDEFDEIAFDEGWT